MTEVRLIPVTGSEPAIVDEADFEWLSAFTWFVSRGSHGKPYVCTRNLGLLGVRGQCRMHRLIMNARPGVQVDHINRNPLDNRRSNLRLANTSQNMANGPLLRNNTSGFRGVCFHRAAGKWAARVKVHGRSIHIGLFTSAIDAAAAYDAAAKEYFGEFAFANLPGVKALEMTLRKVVEV